jgi:uncharacterized protein
VRRGRQFRFAPAETRARRYAQPMIIKAAVIVLACLGVIACQAGHRDSVHRDRSDPPALTCGRGTQQRVSPAEPLVIGDTFTIESKIMGEVRRVNVLIPTVYGQKPAASLPVLYMLDGGLDEDFLHIAGLVQILVSDGSMRPFVLVGIPNTSRRRDMTGPTSSAEDRKIAPAVGGSATFRRFIKEELMPTIRARYQTTDEAGIMGESLAGLFVVETFFVEPALFSSYIAIDPSIWWDNEELVKSADARLIEAPPSGKSLFLASSDEPVIAGCTARLAAAAQVHPVQGFAFHYLPLPAESHATIYHPAALMALRILFPPPVPTKE